ncbi:MAG: autotransporter domain-containing protein [Brevundimonas sp.]
MRILLATAAALAPLMAAAGAHAEVVISSNRTTPISTSNATGSAPDNIRLASGGTITLASGAAVTIDSNHSVDLDGGSQITMSNSASGSTAILATGGQTADITIGGAITVNDDIANAEDSDSDGDADGRFANGDNRYGLRITGPSPFTGDILVENTGSIIVQGNNSAGILIETDLAGALMTRGAVNVLGDGSYGVRTQGDVESVRIGSGVSAQGEGSVAVAIDGDVSGQVRLQGPITATGYRYTSRPPTAGGEQFSPGALYYEDLDDDDILQGGPAVRIAGDVGGGVLLDVAPRYVGGGVDGDDDNDGVENGDEDDDGDGVTNATDTDRDGDGVLDAQETDSSVNVFGAAPAVVVGSTTRATTLGAVGTGDAAYGFINRGSITSQGLLDDVDSTAIQLGAGQAVSIAGGVSNSGTVSAAAYAGDARALLINSGVTAPVIRNSGALQATVLSEDADSAITVDIAAGAAVAGLDNSGSITANLGGEAGDAVAVRDRSGGLNSITNTGTIIAVVSPTDDEDDADDGNTDAGDEIVTGRAIAIDVSANTAGVTIVQSGATTPDYYADLDGDDTPDFEDTDDDGDGVPDAEDDQDNDNDNDGVPNSREPLISGQILLGSGADVLDVRNGRVAGDIAFGTGADRLIISGGAEVRGGLSDADGLLEIDVQDGVLETRQAETLDLTTLTVADEGSLLVTVDPLSGSGGLNVSGVADLAAGASLGARFTSLVEGEQRLVLVQAGDLQADGVDLSTVGDNSPFIYNVEAGIDATADQLFVDVRRKTSDELGFIASEAGAYDAVYEALGLNEALRGAFLSQTDREGLLDLYEQMLPEHGGGALMSLATGVDAVTRALTGRNEVLSPGQSSAWLQEINFYADKDKTDSYGFRSEGFGVAGGYERGTGFGNVGLSVAFTSSDIEDPEAAAEENLAASLIELGLYWRAQGQYWTTWARAAAGYAFMDSTREIVNESLSLQTEADWNGYTLAAAGGVSYRHQVGRFELRPEVYAEYFWLQEDGYEESGAGDGFDLIVDDRSGHVFSATAAMNIGARLGRDGWIRPELRVGWRQYLSVDSGETVGRFSGGTQQFLLANGAIEGGGPILGLRLGIGNELGLLTIQADAESIEDYVRYSLLLRATFRF